MWPEIKPHYYQPLLTKLQNKEDWAGQIKYIIPILKFVFDTDNGYNLTRKTFL